MLGRQALKASGTKTAGPPEELAAACRRGRHQAVVFMRLARPAEGVSHELPGTPSLPSVAGETR